MLLVSSSAEFMTRLWRPQKRFSAFVLELTDCGIGDLPPREQGLVWDPRGHGAAATSPELTAYVTCCAHGCVTQTHSGVTTTPGGKYYGYTWRPGT